MTCLVTGATGFVGRVLTERLRDAGHTVRGVARSSAPDVAAIDLAEWPASTNVLDNVDVVFHLAAKTHDMQEAAGAEADYRRTNVEGTRRVVDAAHAAGVRRVVLVSSVKAVDEGNDVPADEDTPARPSTPYGRSKLDAERLVMAAPFESVCLRFPLIYGPGQRGNLDRMIGAIERGRFPPPPRNGNRRSMLHVSNAVDALLLAAFHPRAAGRIYHVADAAAYSTREVYDAIRAALGLPPTPSAVPLWVFRALARGGDLARVVARRRVGFDSDAFQKLLGSAAYDIGRARRELGYEPRLALASSLPEIVAWRRRVTPA